MEVDTHRELYPSLLRRIQSSVIDFLLILALMVAITQIAEQFEDFPVTLKIICFVLILLYEPICITVGCTLGNWITKIRVKQYEDENRKINFLQALIRYVIKVMLGWLSFITIHFNAEKRAIHDIVIGSVMIKVE